jgi:PEP-CTERM motif
MPAVSGRWLSSFETTLHGSFFAKTDQYGFTGGVVKIAGAALGGVTFVDPILTIDQSFLASNPDTTISLPDGIGNAPMNSVPEPSSYVLWLAGLAVVWVVRRRLRA